MGVLFFTIVCIHPHGEKTSITRFLKAIPFKKFTRTCKILRFLLSSITLGEYNAEKARCMRLAGLLYSSLTDPLVPTLLLQVCCATRWAVYTLIVGYFCEMTVTFLEDDVIASHRMCGSNSMHEFKSSIFVAEFKWEYSPPAIVRRKQDG